jgi:hypothetical protein
VEKQWVAELFYIVIQFLVIDILRFLVITLKIPKEIDRIFALNSPMLNFLNIEDLFWFPMDLLVNAELSSLSETGVTARKFALIRLFSTMDIAVLLQILTKGESLATDLTDMSAVDAVGFKVSLERLGGGAELVAAEVRAVESKFHN